jgi:ssDNA-binding Zn-finger/Zn-ribbon topoisomerase 1
MQLFSIEIQATSKNGTFVVCFNFNSCKFNAHVDKINFLLNWLFYASWKNWFLLLEPEPELKDLEPKFVGSCFGKEPIGS